MPKSDHLGKKGSELTRNDVFSTNQCETGQMLPKTVLNDEMSHYDQFLKLQVFEVFSTKIDKKKVS